MQKWQVKTFFSTAVWSSEGDSAALQLAEGDAAALLKAGGGEWKGAAAAEGADGPPQHRAPEPEEQRPS